MLFKKKIQEKIICFFCNIEASKEESFTLEYKSIDGKGNVQACPMCAGMLDDMMKEVRETYESD
jgi:hypothetical protein